MTNPPGNTARRSEAMLFETESTGYCNGLAFPAAGQQLNFEI